MSQTLQMIIGICSLIALIGGFYKWHHNSLKELQKQIDDLKLKMKDLEKKDDLQQQTIDQLNQLYPLFETVFHSLNKGKK